MGEWPRKCDGHTRHLGALMFIHSVVFDIRHEMTSRQKARPATASGRSGHNLVVVQGRPRGEDELVACLMDQPDATEPHQGVVSVFGSDVAVGAVADQLVHGPRPLVVRVDQPGQDTPIVHVVRLDHWVRLLYGHGSSRSCAQGPGADHYPRRGRWLWMPASVNRPEPVQMLKSKLMHYPLTLDNVCYVNLLGKGPLLAQAE